MATRMLPLLILAACSRAPDYSACKLVGTWEVQHRIRNMFGMTSDSKPESYGNFTRLPPKASFGLLATERFTSDGSWLRVDWPCSVNGFHAPATREDGILYDRCAPRETKGRWTLVEEGAQRIVIDVIEADGAVARHEYEPVDAEQLALRDAQADGRMVRVKDAK